MYAYNCTSQRESHSKAYAFLVTIASKALHLQAVGIANEGIIESFNIEATTKVNMDSDSRVNNFLFRIMNTGGLDVCKRARNGKIRDIKLRMINLDNGVNALVWKSIWYFEKVFPLTDFDVEVHLNENDILKTQSSCVNKVRSAKTVCINRSQSIPFIRLKNPVRYVDIQFKSMLEHEGCMISMKSILTRDKER